MNRARPWVAVVLLFAVIVAPLWASTQAASASSGSDRSPAAPIAGALAAVTGIAISPLLGTAAYGAYQYFQTRADERASLPWYAQLSFWGPALLVVGAVAAKDALGAALPPGWKKPLDVLETVENKVSGLVAAGAVVPITMSGLSKVLVSAEPTSTVAEASAIFHPSGLATIQLAALEGSSLLNLLTVPLGLAIFAVVWMASHAINVLILLSPWGAVDAALKAARTGVLGLVTLTATLDPYVSLALSLVVIVFAYFVAGWAFRLTVFGSLFCWDFFTGASGRFRVKHESNPLFSAGKLKGVPPRTYGRLVRRETGELMFVYRPWLVLPAKEVTLPPASRIVVGRGLFFSLLEVDGGGLALLLPRYRGHEDDLIAALGFSGVRDAGLRRAWSWIRETLGFGPQVTAGAV